MWARFGPYHLARLEAAATLLSACGWSVIGLEIASQDLYDWTPVAGSRHFKRHTLFENARYEKLGWMQIAKATWKFLEATRPQAVAINGWSMAEAWTGCLWARLHEARVIIFSESLPKAGRKSWVHEMIKRAVVFSCHRAIVGGSPHRDYIVRLGMPAESVELGYDVVDNDYFIREAARVRDSEEATRERFNLPARYFYCNCRFIARKNIDGLLKAYAKYRIRVSEPWTLVISGGGEEEGNLKSLAVELGLADVSWPGFLQYDELPAYYGCASAFIHPAYSEPWGLVVNEAGATGLPLLVSSPTGSASELVKHEWNGLLFDPTHCDALQNAMVRITQMEDAERKLMEQNSAELLMSWGPERFAKAMRTSLLDLSKSA